MAYLTRSNMLYLLFDFWRTIVDPPDLDHYYRYRVTKLLEACGMKNSFPIDSALSVYKRILDLFDSKRKAKSIEIPASLEVSTFLSYLGIERLEEEHMKAYAAPMVDLTTPKPGVKQTLEHLSKQGFSMAVVSNTPYHDMVVEKLKKEGMLQFFDSVVSSHKVGVRKPRRWMFEYALESIGGSVDKAVMIGDSPYEDILGARRLGIRTIWMFREGFNVPPSDGMIKSLKELPKLLEVIL